MSTYEMGPTQLQLRRAAMIARGMSRSQVADAEGVSVDSIKKTIHWLAVRMEVKTVVGQSMPLILELARRKWLVWDRDRQFLTVNRDMFKQTPPF